MGHTRGEKMGLCTPPRDFGHSWGLHTSIAARCMFRKRRFSEAASNDGNRALSEGKNRASMGYEHKLLLWIHPGKEEEEARLCGCRRSKQMDF